MTADLMRKSSDGLWEAAQDAIEGKDLPALDAYIEEAKRRTSRAAKRLLEQLEAAREELHDDLCGGRPRGGAKRISLTAQSVLLVTDARVDEYRKKIVQEAKRSVWLSSYILEDKELVDLLIARAKEGVKIRVIVSPGPSKRGKTKELVAVLKKAAEECSKIRLFVETNHSKCVVADRHKVMIGSANLKACFRDAMIVFDDAAIAKAIVSYVKAEVSPQITESSWVRFG